MTRSRKPAGGFSPRRLRPLEALEDRTTPAFPATIDLGSLSAATGATLNGAEQSVTGIGDINGDGFADVAIVGPTGISGLGERVSVVFGSASVSSANLNGLDVLNGRNGFVITPPGPAALGDYRGPQSLVLSVAALGDVNGDGIDDFGIGDYTLRDGSASVGKGQAYVIFGSRTELTAPIFNLGRLNGVNGFTITKGNGDADFGAVHTAGDVNGDGLADVLVAAPDGGADYVLFGSASPFTANVNVSALNGRNGFVITGQTVNDAHDTSISTAGDVNGDGAADIIINAPGTEGSDSKPGRVYVVFGRKSGFPANLDASALNGSNGFTITNQSGNAPYFGTSASTAGDVNGDGVADVIIGAPDAAAGGSNRGQAYVVFGRKSGFPANLDVSALNGSNGFTINGPADNNWLGDAVSGGQDMNGDGLADMVVGAPDVTNYTGSGKGHAYVIFGSKNPFPANFDPNTLNGQTGFTLNGANDFGLTGISVGMAGDVNGDGVAEALVGASVQHYLIYGQDTAAPTAALTSAPSVASTATDFTKYVFQVTYTDAGRLQRSTLDNSDIEVVAPNGAVIPAQLVSVTPDADAGTLLATYSIAAPGGQFTVPNGGTYTVRIRANQVSDHGNNVVAAGDLGTFRVDVTAAGPDTTAPTAALTSAPTITRATTDLSQYTFQVTYQDNERVKVATLDNNDIAVIAADGTAYSTQLVSAVPNTDVGTIVATYRLNPLRDSDRFTPADRGTYTIRMAASQVSDQAGNFVAAGDLGTFQIAISLASADRFAVGPGAGGNSPVTVRDVSNNALATVDAFPGFTGGVRVAEADVNGDGTPDLIAGTGPGVATQVKVISGKDGSTLFTVQPFEATFTGGVFVAAGDINGDGRAEVIVTPDEGGGPVVAVYDGAKITAGGSGDAAQTIRFFGIDDPSFRGGARAASADVNNDGYDDLVVAAGFGGGPRVAVFSGQSLVGGSEPAKLVGDFFVFEQTLRNGVFVGSGDLDGDDFADVIIGGGPGGGPRVFALSGQDLVNGTQTPMANFFAGDSANRGGIRLAVKDLDGDGKADLVTGAGDNAGSQVTAYAGKDIPANGTPSSPLFQFDAVPGFANGVYVG